MPQGPIGSTIATKNGAQAPALLDGTGNLITAQGVNTVLNVTAATVIKATPGRLVKICVTVAGAAGTANDCITTGAAAAANVLCAIPATVGVIAVDMPAKVGIVITPGAAQVVSVSYD